MLFVCKYDEFISMKSNNVNYELGVRDRAVRWNNGGADDTRALSRLASDWQRSAGRHPRPPTCPPGSQTGTGTIIAGDHLYPEPYKRLPRRGYAHQPARHRAHTPPLHQSPIPHQSFKHLREYLDDIIVHDGALHSTILADGGVPELVSSGHSKN